MERYSGNFERDLAIVACNRLAEKITGGLSKPGKMPEGSWGLSATRCQLGAVLAQTPDTVCSHCYALRGRYNFPRVQAKMERRYQGLEHDLWVPSMVLLVRWWVGRFFRWFDTGDLQSVDHLHNICQVAQYTPDIQHWLPTRETEIVKDYDGQVPDNLVIRVSGNTVDGPAPAAWPQTSVVISGDSPPPNTHLCPALDQGNVCGECRACWDKDVANVAYRLH